MIEGLTARRQHPRVSKNIVLESVSHHWQTAEQISEKCGIPTIERNVVLRRLVELIKEKSIERKRLHSGAGHTQEYRLYDTS
jgi:predicted ArsR family transcriptional regulator